MSRGFYCNTVWHFTRVIDVVFQGFLPHHFFNQTLDCKRLLLVSTEVLFFGTKIGCKLRCNPNLSSVEGILLALVVVTQFGGGRALPKLLGKRTISPSAVL